MNILSGIGYIVEKILTGHGYLLTRNIFNEFYNKVKLLQTAFSSGKDISAKTILSKALADSGLAAIPSEYRKIISETKSKYCFLEKEFNN